MALDTTARPSRRTLLAGALGGVAGLVATALGRIQPAEAANGQAVTVGGTFSGTSPTSITNSAGDGIIARNTSTSASGLFAHATATTGATFGAFGRSDSTSGVGVGGANYQGTGTTRGVKGEAASPSGYGVDGIASAGTGVRGITSSGVGVRGEASSGVARIRLVGERDGAVGDRQGRVQQVRPGVDPREQELRRHHPGRRACEHSEYPRAAPGEPIRSLGQGGPHQLPEPGKARTEQGGLHDAQHASLLVRNRLTPRRRRRRNLRSFAPEMPHTV